MTKFTQILEEQAVKEMRTFEDMFKEFEKKYPYALKKLIQLDHFCWDCAEDEEHDVIVDKLFEENLIKQIYTSFPDKKHPFRKISLIRLGGYPIEFGFLKEYSFTGFRYLELAAQNPERTQVRGLDHVELVYKNHANHNDQFKYSDLYRIVKKHFIVSEIYRENAGNIFEIQSRANGFKLRFVNDFLINVIARNEIIVKE